jgi:hypothetical protein
VLKAAMQKKAPREEACAMFKTIGGRSQDGQVHQDELADVRHSRRGRAQMKANHARTMKTQTQICAAAAGPRKPTGPGLSEALGTTRGGTLDPLRPQSGTLDTLTGNVLADERRRPRRRLDRKLGRYARAALAPPYLRLARADRPIGAGCCCCRAGGRRPCRDRGRTPYPNPGTSLLFFVGAFVMRGAGCTWNDIVDRDLDAQVARTRSRPIPPAR